MLRFLTAVGSTVNPHRLDGENDGWMEAVEGDPKRGSREGWRFCREVHSRLYPMRSI